MSEQCRDWTRIENPGQSVGWRCNTHGDGYYVGDRSPYLCRVGRAAETVHILTDLIAELRGQADIWQEGDINEDRWDYPAMMLRAHADWAEARLRELE